MKTIQISFENTNALKRWLLSLDEHLREINLTNPPRQPRSVFWRSNRNSATYEPLASDSIFRRFDEYYPNGVLLNLVDRDGDSKFELSISIMGSASDISLDPPSGFLSLMHNLKQTAFMERQLTCGTLVKDVLPSPLRFTIANMPTYVSAMVEDLLLQREDEINERMQKHYMRNHTFSTKEKLIDFFSSYGILAYALNHVHWDDIGLAPLLKPIYAHWKGLGHSSTPQSLPTSSDYVATSGTITLGDPADELEVALDTLLTNLADSEPTTITTPDPNGRGSVTRWASSPPLGYAYANLPWNRTPDFDPFP